MTKMKENKDMNSEIIKQFALDQGADLVGIAPVARFDEAPLGHMPEDILAGAASVIVCALRMAEGLMTAPATAYHNSMQIVHLELDALAHKIALFLEKEWGKAVPVPSDDPYRYWDENNSYGRGDLSHRHAGQAAGLGRLGKNSLLISPQYGNRIHLVSVITDMVLAPDSILDWEPCPKKCSLCLKACPVKALAGNKTVTQALCRTIVFERLPKGQEIESCRRCRLVCPAGLSKEQKI